MLRTQPDTEYKNTPWTAGEVTQGVWNVYDSNNLRIGTTTKREALLMVRRANAQLPIDGKLSTHDYQFILDLLYDTIGVLEARLEKPQKPTLQETLQYRVRRCLAIHDVILEILKERYETDNEQGANPDVLL